MIQIVHTLNLVCPFVGREFKATELLIHLDSERDELHAITKLLKTQGYIEFTGKPLIWKRIK